MCKYPNLDLVIINAYTKFGEILFFCSRYWAETKLWRNDRQPKSSITPLFQSRAIKKTTWNLSRISWVALVVYKWVFVLGPRFVTQYFNSPLQFFNHLAEVLYFNCMLVSCDSWCSVVPRSRFLGHWCPPTWISEGHLQVLGDTPNPSDFYL